MLLLLFFLLSCMIRFTTFAFAAKKLRQSESRLQKNEIATTTLRSKRYENDISVNTKKWQIVRPVKINCIHSTKKTRTFLHKNSLNSNTVSVNCKKYRSVLKNHLKYVIQIITVDIKWSKTIPNKENVFHQLHNIYGISKKSLKHSTF